MARILIVYSTTDGHTIEICRRLKAVIESQTHQEAHQVSLIDFRACSAADITACDKIVIGASIRYGRHNPRLVRFIRRHQNLLDARPNAFFSVNAVARKPEKSRPETNPYLKKLLRQILWKPSQLTVFAGKIDYKKYGWLDRAVIRFIMLLTHGPTDPSGCFEFTDWQQVDAFGHLIRRM